METRSFPKTPAQHRQVDDETEAIRLVGIKPETNLEKAMFWLGTLSGETFSVTERVNMANVYAALALHDAVRDVTVSMVRLDRARTTAVRSPWWWNRR